MRALRSRALGASRGEPRGSGAMFARKLSSRGPDVNGVTCPPMGKKPPDSPAAEPVSPGRPATRFAEAAAKASDIRATFRSGAGQRGWALALQRVSPIRLVARRYSPSLAPSGHSAPAALSRRVRPSRAASLMHAIWRISFFPLVSRACPPGSGLLPLAGRRAPLCGA